MEIVKTHHIFINSNMRTVGRTDDFVITLKNPLTLTNQRNRFQVLVQESVIPHTIKQINSSNNTVQYQIIKGATNYTGSVSLTEGNYNIITLLAELSKNLKSNILVNTGITVTFSMTYNKTVSGVVLSIVGTDSITTTINVKFSQNTTLGGFFGFSVDAVFSYNNLNVSTNALSNNSVNVNPINYIYIRSSSLIQRESYENIVEKDVFSDILAKIAVNVSPGSFIYFSGSPAIIDLDNKVIDQIALYLSDNLSYTLSLNGLSWSTHLVFQEVGTTEPDNLLLAQENTSQPEINNEIIKQIEELKQEIENSKIN